VGVLYRRTLRAISVLGLALALIVVSGCSLSKDESKTLRIVAGSEQKSVLEQVVDPWCKDKGYHCEWTLLGSVDQARLLQSGSEDYDAYWFASSVFAQLGNSDGKLVDLEPMFITPIVFAGKKPAMEKLGFAGRTDVDIEEILEAVEGKKMKVWTTNPTQSNSGATTLFAFLNHFAGNGPGQPLTMEQLDSEPVDEGIKRFVQAMDRTPPSTGTMMNECVSSTECETLFTYEALVIEQNKQRAGDDQFRVVYPKGSLAISDAPLGFLPVGDKKEDKRNIFTELQQYLRTDDDALQKIRDLGRRPADSFGLTLDNPDTSVFNPDWGIQTDIQEQGISYPASSVIEAALDRYHTRYRQPVNTYYCLDGSGSMSGEPWEGVQSAAHEIFDVERARINLLQTGPDDRTSVTVFNQGIKAGPFTVDGNDPSALKKLEQDVRNTPPGGGTNLYQCVDMAVNDIKDDSRKKLIVVMSDGVSAGENQATLDAANKAGIPIVAIAFGDADERQLQALATSTGGAFVDSDDLVKALREAAGYK